MKRMGQKDGVLQKLLDSMEGGLRVRESLAIAYWPSVVGPIVAAVSRAEEVRDGVLYVRTKGSAWSQEIGLMKHQILIGLNQRCGRPVIRDIRFRAGGLTPATSSEEDAQPSPSEVAGVSLTAEEEAALEADRQVAAQLPDAEVRRATLHILEGQYRLRRWRLDHGWKPCAECGALHAGDGDVCTVCLAESQRPPTTPVPIR